MRHETLNVRAFLSLRLVPRESAKGLHIKLEPDGRKPDHMGDKTDMQMA